VAAAEVEIARAQLVELAPTGFEEVDQGEQVELAVYADEAGERTLRAAFPAASSRPVEPGWDERWREFHRPVTVGGVWIGPPWEAVPSGGLAVVIDPSQAFGTGAHATTRLCVELLARQERGSVLDVGCGSGVIALAAMRLGFERVIAVDVDPVAVSCAHDNAERNGVVLDVRLVDALKGELPPADVVVANIALAAVAALLPLLRAPRAITSGYLAGEVPRARGWEVVEERVLDGWAAHVLAS
jgi:ribosomal protein L11 methyltransferase